MVPKTPTGLTHIDAQGRAQMVDISQKNSTEREAIATGRIQMSEATLARALSRDTKKGDPIGISELAGIMAAKRTADLIPLCHPLPLTSVKVSVTENMSLPGLNVSAIVKTSGKTGVEMEALTAVTVTCLTLYDMLKAIDKSMTISDVTLQKKTGGKSGDYNRNETPHG